jgi:hypothetical protein
MSRAFLPRRSSGLKHHLDPARKPAEIQRFSTSSFPVSYNIKKLETIQNQFIEMVLPLIALPEGRKLANETIVEYISQLSISLALQVTRLVQFFKHHAYSREEEYRFLQIHPMQPGKVVPEIRLRSRPYSLVRYREFDWKIVAPKALKQIVIGPSADPRRGPQFVYDCLRAFYPHEVEVVRSKIPYRAG